MTVAEYVLLGRTPHLGYYGTEGKTDRARAAVERRWQDVSRLVKTSCPDVQYDDEARPGRGMGPLPDAIDRSPECPLGGVREYAPKEHRDIPRTPRAYPHGPAQ